LIAQYAKFSDLEPKNDPFILYVVVTISILLLIFGHSEVKRGVIILWSIIAIPLCFGFLGRYVLGFGDFGIAVLSLFGIYVWYLFIRWFSSD